jgi:hypothetical protein
VLGASLAMVSSAVLYINAGIFFVLGGVGVGSGNVVLGQSLHLQYTQTAIFGLNLDSVLNTKRHRHALCLRDAEEG